MIIEQSEPSHWAPSGAVHRPTRCPLCIISRIGGWLGLIQVDSDDHRAKDLELALEVIEAAVELLDATACSTPAEYPCGTCPWCLLDAAIDRWETAP